MTRKGRTGISMVLASMMLASGALAQSITPGGAAKAPSPGGFAPLPQAQPGTAVAAGEKPHTPKATQAEVERKGRTGFDIYLGTYLTLSADCKIGAGPEITFPVPPKNGVTKIRNHPINLRDVPGAPKRTCIGTSPKGVAAIYQSKARFKGEETLTFKVAYPNGDTREVSVKILVQ